jgi:hypothetical protein
MRCPPGDYRYERQSHRDSQDAANEDDSEAT